MSSIRSNLESVNRGGIPYKYIDLKAQIEIRDRGLLASGPGISFWALKFVPMDFHQCYLVPVSLNADRRREFQGAQGRARREVKRTRGP